MFRRITEYFYIAKVTSIVHVQKSVKSIGTKCDACWKFHFGILSFRLYMYFTWNINTPCTLSAQPVAKNRIRCHRTRHLTRIYTVCIDFTATSVVIQNSQKRNHKPCTPNMMQKTHIIYALIKESAGQAIHELFESTKFLWYMKILTFILTQAISLPMNNSFWKCMLSFPLDKKFLSTTENL